jgi:hypothetical protein
VPRISHEHKQLYKSHLRSLLARDHQASQIELVVGMEKLGYKLDRFYLAKLVKEIRSEQIRRADRQTLNLALASFEDTMSQVVKLAWEIASTPYISAPARVMALREIREAHNDVFQKRFDAGEFEKKLGTTDTTIRNAPLPEDRKKAIRDIFEQWGLIEAPKQEDAGTTPPSAETAI